jgi:hypothetical protein
MIWEISPLSVLLFGLKTGVSGIRPYAEKTHQVPASRSLSSVEADGKYLLKKIPFPSDQGNYLSIKRYTK